MGDSLQGFALSAAPWIVAVLGAGGIAAVVRVILDYRRSARKQADDMASQVVGVAMGRLKSVERHAIICDANLAYTRHKASNLGSTIDSMLLLFEVAPERQPEIIAKLKEKRARDEKSEAVERAAILAAAVAAVSEDDVTEESLGSRMSP